MSNIHNSNIIPNSNNKNTKSTFRLLKSDNHISPIKFSSQVKSAISTLNVSNGNELPKIEESPGELIDSKKSVNTPEFHEVEV